jgi:hypothetical protein
VKVENIKGRSATVAIEAKEDVKIHHEMSGAPAPPDEAPQV